MNNTNPNIHLTENIEALYSLKRRIYLRALPFGIVAILIGWAFKSYSGNLTLLESVIFPVLFISCLGMILALRSSQRALTLVEFTLFAITSIALLVRFYEILFLVSASLRVAAFSDLFYWFPLVYVLAFLTFDSQRNHLVGSLLFLGVALIIGFIYGIQDWLSGNTPNMLYVLSRFFMANIVYIILLRISIHINEQSIRKNTLAETMEHLAITDYLTDIANRRQLDKIIAQEVAQVPRHKQQLSGILFDLDHFKRINDNYGHEVGDYVLKEVIQVVQPVLRTTDLIGRWGGEEFFVLALRTDLSNAGILAERLRLAIAAHEFERIGTITASFGVADYQIGEKVDAWFRRIDMSLYQAKQEGRNRVCITK